MKGLVVVYPVLSLVTSDCLGGYELGGGEASNQTTLNDWIGEGNMLQGYSDIITLFRFLEISTNFVRN